MHAQNRESIRVYVLVCDVYVHVCDVYLHVCDVYVYVCDVCVHVCDVWRSRSRWMTTISGRFHTEVAHLQLMG